MPSWRSLALPLATAVLLAGCGISDPYTHRQTQQRPTNPRTTTTAPADAASSGIDGPDGDDGPHPPPSARLPSSAYSRSPRAALTRYAQLYLNWTWTTVTSAERQLAAMSQGQARAQALAGARRPSGQLQKYQVANAGQLAALAAGQGPETGKWAVVADERTTGAGPYLGLPGVSEVIWATVARTPQGWIVTGWYPAGAAP